MGKTSISFSAALVLQATAHGYAYGFEIMDVTGLPSGTVYPALRRLEDHGYLRSRWEKHETAQQELRPPRKYYEVTPDGETALAEAVKRYRVLDQAHAAWERREKPAGGRA